MNIYIEKPYHLYNDRSFRIYTIYSWKCKFSGELEISQSSTKYSPIELFFGTNKSIFEDIYKNTLTYYMKSQKNNIVY